MELIDISDTSGFTFEEKAANLFAKLMEIPKDEFAKAVLETHLGHVGTVISESLKYMPIEP